MSTFTHLYFAYGANLSQIEMRKHCPGAKVVGRAVLADHCLTFPRRDDLWQNGGVASIQPAPGERVEGAVYQITEAHVDALDLYEAVAEGEYRRGQVMVELWDGRRVEAMTYFAEPEADGPFVPSAAYRELLLAGAREHGLTEAWLSFLQSSFTRRRSAPLRAGR